jgi:carboxyl-terminal processing protease
MVSRNSGAAFLVAFLEGILSLGLLYVAYKMLIGSAVFAEWWRRGWPIRLYTFLAFLVLIGGSAGVWRLGRRATRSSVIQGLRWRQILGFVLVAVVAYQIWLAVRPLPEVPGASREVVAVLDQTLNLLENYHWRAKEFDWAAVRRTAFQRAEGADHIRRAVPIIQDVVKLFGDDHTYLTQINWRDDFTAPGDTPGKPSQLPMPRGQLLDRRIACIEVPRFVDPSGLGSLFSFQDGPAQEYVRTLQRLLVSLDKQDPEGWIVDLRSNEGGSVWPMLEGLSPLVPEGELYSLDMPQFGRRVTTWFVYGRVTQFPWLCAFPLGNPPPRLVRGRAPVAVLIGPKTGSAGEAVAIAFKGRPSTRFIGAATGGLTTAPMSFDLGHTLVLFVTIGRLRDSLGNAYGGPIEPDENIGTDSEEHDRTAALEAAGRWIIEQATHRPSLGVGQVADGHVGRFLRERVLIPGTAHAFRRIPEVEVLVPIEGEVDPEGIEEGDQIIATGTAR